MTGRGEGSFKLNDKCDNPSFAMKPKCITYQTMTGHNLTILLIKKMQYGSDPTWQVELDDCWKFGVQNQCKLQIAAPHFVMDIQNG